MTTIKGTAPMRMELEFNGTEGELIDLADSLSRETGDIGLDSLDIGDAMGFFLTECMMEGGEYTVIRNSLILQCTISYDNFEWQGI